MTVDLPNLAVQWMVGNLSTLLAELGDRWPACAPDLTDEIAIGLFLSQALYNLRGAAVAEELRVRAYRAMAAAFEQVDFIIAATNPSPAFAADARDEQPERQLRRLGEVERGRRASAFGRVLGGVRAHRGRVPECADLAARPGRVALSRPRADGRPHDDLEPLRQSRRVDTRRLRRRAPGRHAGARAPPRRRAALRRRPVDGAPRPLAAWWPGGRSPSPNAGRTEPSRAGRPRRPLARHCAAAMQEECSQWTTSTGRC